MIDILDSCLIFIVISHCQAGFFYFHVDVYFYFLFADKKLIVVRSTFIEYERIMYFLVTQYAQESDDFCTLMNNPFGLCMSERWKWFMEVHRSCSLAAFCYSFYLPLGLTTSRRPLESSMPFNQFSPHTTTDVKPNWVHKPETIHKSHTEKVFVSLHPFAGGNGRR